jgi:hypothetical protein
VNLPGVLIVLALLVAVFLQLRLIDTELLVASELHTTFGFLVKAFKEQLVAAGADRYSLRDLCCGDSSQEGNDEDEFDHLEDLVK